MEVNESTNVTVLENQKQSSPIKQW